MTFRLNRTGTSVTPSTLIGVARGSHCLRLVALLSFVLLFCVFVEQLLVALVGPFPTSVKEAQSEKLHV